MLKLGKIGIQAGIFLIIILDASKLSPLVYILFLKVHYSIRYLHFSNTTQIPNYRIPLSRQDISRIRWIC